LDEGVSPLGGADEQTLFKGTKEETLMKNLTQILARCGTAAAISFAALAAFAQPASRGSVVVYPVVFKEGTVTSRAKAEEAMMEVLKKGGFKIIEGKAAARAWKSRGMRTPTTNRPPTMSELARVGRAVGADYVTTAHVEFHTRSIWVNLGPKTVSSCHIAITIVDTKTAKVVHETEADGRSDEKSDGLKVAAALLITPLITAVSGGPKTPQETRAAQIAAARALEKFVVAKDEPAAMYGTWEWFRYEGMDDSILSVENPSRYLLTLERDGTASGLADVNRFRGTFSTNGSALTFSSFVTTKVGVPSNSLHNRYLGSLSDVTSWVVRGGQLHLALKVDAGMMVFRRQA
jgi:heat shock protein HslJ